MRRAALWAEAGELYRGRLAQPEKAERLLSQALEADPKNRLALEGMLALAESRRDGGQLCRCLKALAELAEDARERVRYFRRLAVAARDLAFDLDLAAHAYVEVLKVERDDLPALGELCALQRRRSDWAGLSWALEQRATAAEAAGDKRLAAAALRELSQIQEARLGRAGEALVALEKAARLFPEANTLLELANLSLRCERPLNARRALEDVLAILPKHAAPERLAEVRARLGRACDLLGDKDGARENYALAFPLRRLDDELSGRLEALYEEAGARVELTDLWAARAQALLQAGRGHDAAPLFFKSAQSLLRSGDTAGAVLRLSAALDAAPTGDRAAETLEAMAELELNRGERLEAAKLFARRAGLEVIPRAAARLFFRAASLAQGSAREEGYLASALQQDLGFIPARLRRAELQLGTDPRAALVDLEAVLEADPKDPDVAGAQLDRISLLRKAGFAALQANQHDAARRPGTARSTPRTGPTTSRHWSSSPRFTAAAEPRSRWSICSASCGLASKALPAVPRGASLPRALSRWVAPRLRSKRFARFSTTSRKTRGPRRSCCRCCLRVPTASPSARRSSRASSTAPMARRGPSCSRAAASSAARREISTPRAPTCSTPRSCRRARCHCCVLWRPLRSRRRMADAAELSAWKLALQAAPQDDVSLQKDAAERLLELARSRSDAKDGERAREAFEALVGLPLSPAERHEAWYGLARTSLANGDVSRAESALLEASKQGPAAQRVTALMERAGLQEGRDARSDAVQSFEAALALAPRHPQATEGLKRNLRAVQDFEGLAEVLATEAASAPKPKAAGLYRELYYLYLEQLHSKGPAEAALRRVVTLDESDVAARAQLAGLLAERGELEESTQLLEQAAGGMSDVDAARVLREGAAAVRKAGDQQTALRLLRKARRRLPSSDGA